MPLTPVSSRQRASANLAHAQDPGLKCKPGRGGQLAQPPSSLATRALGAEVIGLIRMKELCPANPAIG